MTLNAPDPGQFGSDSTANTGAAPYGEWDQHARITFEDSGMPTAEIRHHHVKVVAYQDAEDDNMLHVEVHADDTVTIREDRTPQKGMRMYDAHDMAVRANGPDEFVIESLWATVTVAYSDGTTGVVVDGNASVERHTFDPRHL